MHLSKLSPEDQATLDALYENLRTASQHMLGYQVAKDFDYSPLFRFLKWPKNNVGDPFTDSTYRVTTRVIEREVIKFFGSLFRMPADEVWGYVTSGGTEGNLYGLYLAREAHPDGIVYLSEETHYSVAKNVHLLRMPRIIVKAQPNGEIDYQDFLLKVSENKEKPVIVFANLGTTMKEARDDVTRIIALLDTLGIPKNKRHIHVDGALCAPYAEFLSPKPGFDFTDGADSLAVSGHKFIGSPVPCGVVLARKTLVEKVGKKISYIGTTDCTVAGSRSAFAPLVLWYAVRTMGVDGLKARYLDAKELAGYAVERLEKAGIEAWRNPGALTVVLPPVSEELKGKWQLATSKTESHVVVMPGVEKQELDACLDDIIAEHEQKKGIARVDSAVSMAVVETN